MQRNIPVQLPDGYIDFFSELESWQNQQQIMLQSALAYPVQDAVKQLNKHHKPLLSITGMEIDPDQYQQVLLDLVAFLAKNRPDLDSTLKRIRNAAPDFNYPVILKDLVEQDMTNLILLAQEIDVTNELFIFVLDHAMRPFLRVYAAPYLNSLFEYTYNYWTLPAICPVCGSKSHFSRLRSEDGRRFMFCDRCFTEWEARYLECIHCGNDEPGKINFMSIENDEAYQIYTCEKCKGYLKTFDERSSGKSTDLFIANIETIYLDLLAAEKGYSNHNDDWSDNE